MVVIRGTSSLQCITKLLIFKGIWRKVRMDDGFMKQPRNSISVQGLIRCSHCTEWLPKESFGIVQGRAGTGRQSYCKLCVKTMGKSVKRKRSPAWHARSREYSKAAYRANPEKAYTKKARRRARLANVLSERIYRWRVYFDWNGLCGICWSFVDPTRWHLDHIIPIAKSGHHLYNNVQPAHPFCNISKGART